MRERKQGVILNIGSTAGLRPRPGLTWYNASKAAVKPRIEIDGGRACFPTASVSTRFVRSWARPD